MEALTLLSSPQKEPISILNDPFKMKCITSFRTWVYTGNGGWSASCRGAVEFVNGETKGEQGFSAPDFSTLVQKMEAFIGTLGA